MRPTRAAGATPLPYLFVCAFIANAASFVLPISNPANLVIFGRNMPLLASWLAQFALPSIVAIAATYLALRFMLRGALAKERIAFESARPLRPGGRLTLYGIGAIAIVLLGCSALDLQLGLPTFICGVVTSAIVLVLTRQSPWPVIRGVSWNVLPLVAGLFVLVEALDYTGVIAALSAVVHTALMKTVTGTAWGSGRGRRRVQSHEQSAGRTYCWLSRRDGPITISRHWRAADRRRSWTKPLGYGLARDYSLAGHAAA